MVVVPKRRRWWSTEEMQMMVLESFEQGKTISIVARQHGVNPRQLLDWRNLYEDGGLSAVCASEEIVPASALSEALKRIEELQQALNEKSMTLDILYKVLGDDGARKSSGPTSLA